MIGVRDGEGGEVDVDGLGDGDEEVGGYDFVDVVVDKWPDGEGGPLEVSPCCETGEDEDVGGEGVEFVVVSSAGAEDDAVNLIAREGELEK